MKTSLLFPTLAVSVAVILPTTVCAGETGATPQFTPLEPVSSCLVPDDVKHWGVIDQRRLVVEAAGSRYYDILLTSDCATLESRPRISFRNGSSSSFTTGTLAGNNGADDPRICGDINDAVIASGSEPGPALACDIARIRRIDKATFEAVFDTSAEEGNAVLDAATENPGLASVD